MSGSLLSLLATAIHQTRNPLADPAPLERTYSLLTRAGSGEAVTIELTPRGLTVNGLEILPDAPGSAIVLDALGLHGTGRLQLPAAMEARHWRQVVAIYATAPGTYTSGEEILAALRDSIPTIEVWAIASTATDGQNVNRSLATPMSQPLGDATLSTRGADLGDFSSQLGQLFTEGTAAAQRDDSAALAEILLKLAEMEQGDSALRTIVGKERQRLLSPVIIQWLVQEALRSNAPPAIGLALRSVGTHAVDPLLTALGQSTVPRERDVLMQILDRMPDLEGMIKAALQEVAPMLTKGAAEVAGRRHIESAIPALSALLRGPDADLRTAAWRALEEIGTRDAIEALRTRGR